MILILGTLDISGLMNYGTVRVADECVKHETASPTQ